MKRGMLVLLSVLLLFTACSDETTNQNQGKEEYMATYYQELYRPQYHITPEKNWLNDPNGLVFYEGKYHVFYQYNPDTKFPGDEKYWAHVSSTDLVHWETQPVALSPDQYGSMWSGSAVVDEHNTSGLFGETGSGLVAFYTVTGSGQRQQQAMAYSKDGGTTWVKYNDGKPIITTKDDPMRDGAFRDPKVFWHEESGKWMMIVAGGPLRFYSSDNLIDWNQEGYTGNIHTECPDLFRMKIEGTEEYKWVLSGGGVWYRIGDFKQVNGVWSFVPETEGRRFNFGPDVYAGQTFYGTGDRIIMIEWMTDVGYAMDTGRVTDPWSGALTLPYELTLKKEGTDYILYSNSVDELSSLRGDVVEFKNLTLKENSENPLIELQKDVYEIKATLDVGENAGFSLALRIGNGQKTTFSYQPDSKVFSLDRSASGASPTGRFLSNYTVPATPKDGKITLHIFVDISSVEIFAMDGKYPFTALIFPDETSVGMELSAIGGEIKVEELTIWELSSIYDKKSYQTKPMDLDVSSEKQEAFVGDVFTVWAVPTPLDVADVNIEWVVGDGFEIVNTKKKAIVLKAVKEGTYKVGFYATAGEKKYVDSVEIENVKNGFHTNLGDFTVYGGTWKITKDGLYASGRGNSPVLFDSEATDFVYEATFHYTGSNIGCALIFRSTDDLSRYYTADINLSARSARILLFDRNPSTGASSDITLGKPFTFVVASDNVYALRIEAKGSLLQFYVNDVLAVSVNDESLAKGKLGLNLCDADGYFTSVQLTDSPS